MNINEYMYLDSLRIKDVFVYKGRQTKFGLKGCFNNILWCMYIFFVNISTPNRIVR